MFARLSFFIFLFLTFIFSPCSGQSVALNFDGSNDYVPTTTPALRGSAQRTIEAWIRTTANCDPNNSGRQKVIADMGDQKTGQRFTFNVLFRNAIRLEVSGSGISAKTPVNDGKWHHVAVTYNPRRTPDFKLFVDGKLDTAGDLTTSVNTSTTNGLVIGRRIDGTNSFSGDIDEVRVWNYARTDSSIKADMNTEYCKYPSGLVAYYKLNEGVAGGNNSSNTKATNYANSSSSGTLTNFALSNNSSNWVSGNKLFGGPTSDTLTVFECHSYTRPGGTKKYTLSGKYIETITNAAGCDSIINIHLTIGKSTNYQEVDGCDSFRLTKGRTIYKSGYYQDTLKDGNAVGCDSIIYYKVSIRRKSFTADTMNFCDSVRINGNWYFDSQKLDLYMSNRFGCDSTHSIYLVSNKSSSYHQLEEACKEYSLPSGLKVTQSGTYYDTIENGNSVGCDSLVIIKLTINKKDENLVETQACDTFVSPSGKWYTSSGDYMEQFMNAKGCDSIVTYRILVNESSSTSDKMEVCDSVIIDTKWYYESEQIEVLKTDQYGCDSIIDLDLIITRIDTSVRRMGNDLMAEQSGASYQWRDCESNNLIRGATSQTFSPERLGSYAVDISVNNCMKRSSCFTTSNVGIGYVKRKNMRISPVPAHRVIVVDFEVIFEMSSYTIRDIQGRNVQKGHLLSGDKILLGNAIKLGIYTLEVQFDGGILRENFIVH